MKASELKSLSIEELASKGQALKQELFNLKFQQYTGRLENTAKLGALRKDIARINTIIRQKQAE